DSGRRRARRGPRLAPFQTAFKYSWTNWTAIAPSPTAEATRLTEPERTSPAADTPGRGGSSGDGARRGGAPGGAGERRAGGGAAGVGLDGGGEPVGPGDGADEAEEGRGLQGPDRAGLAVGDLDPGELAVAGHAADLGVAQDLDVVRLLDPAGQVAGHAPVQ